MHLPYIGLKMHIFLGKFVANKFQKHAHVYSVLAEGPAVMFEAVCMSLFPQYQCGLLHYSTPIMQKLPGQPFGLHMPSICNSDRGAMTAQASGQQQNQLARNDICQNLPLERS